MTFSLSRGFTSGTPGQTDWIRGNFRTGQLTLPGDRLLRGLRVEFLSQTRVGCCPLFARRAAVDIALRWASEEQGQSA